jgi:signal transduction histidine kinase
MESLLNALLDLSKLDAGVVEARPRCFPVNKVFHQVASQFQPVAEARNIRLSHRAEPCGLIPTRSGRAHPRPIWSPMRCATPSAAGADRRASVGKDGCDLR